MNLEPQSVTAEDQADLLDRAEERLWILQAQAGDRDAFGKLLARHERPLIYFLRRLLRDPEQVLDAHQELWLDVFRGLRKLRAPEAFRAWLYRLARARAARHFKRDRREESVFVSLGEEHDWAQEESSCVDAESLCQALDCLPQPYREVLTLHYLKDLSLAEIAEATDCPVGTIKSRLHHARGAMRRHLERKSHA